MSGMLFWDTVYYKKSTEEIDLTEFVLLVIAAASWVKKVVAKNCKFPTHGRTLMVYLPPGSAASKAR